MEKIFVKISWQDNYGASYDDASGCVVATHKTLDGVKKGFESALKFHIEGLDKSEISASLQGEYKLVFKLDVHALLNHYKGIITLKALSKFTGINEKQLGHYTQGIRTPRPEQRQKIIKGIHHLGEELLAVV